MRMPASAVLFACVCRGMPASAASAVRLYADACIRSSVACICCLHPQFCCLHLSHPASVACICCLHLLPAYAEACLHTQRHACIRSFVCIPRFEAASSKLSSNLSNKLSSICCLHTQRHACKENLKELLLRLLQSCYSVYYFTNTNKLSSKLSNKLSNLCHFKFSLPALAALFAYLDSQLASLHALLVQKYKY